MNKRRKSKKKIRVVALTPSTNVTTTTFCGGKKKMSRVGAPYRFVKRMYFSAVWLLIFSIVHLLSRRFRVAMLRPLGSRNPGR